MAAPCRMREKACGWMLLEQLMNQLDKRERMLIRMRFYENKTQVQVAQSLEMSQVQVSRLEKKVPHTDEGMYELRGNRTKVLEKIRRYIMRKKAWMPEIACNDVWKG